MTTKKNLFSTGQGALPSQLIRTMIRAKAIEGARPENVQPSSLDLTLTSEMYRLDGIFLPRVTEQVESIISQLGAASHHTDNPLERDLVYLCRLNETFSLPKQIYGYANPKSSVGRNDVQVRLLADNVCRYDSLTGAGFSGSVWLSITPHSFPVKLVVGDSLIQVRFFNQDTRLNELDMELAYREHQLLWDRRGKAIPYTNIVTGDLDGALILTIDLERVRGWECLGTNHVLDFSRRKENPRDFFQQLTVQDGRVTLRRNGFYVLATREWVRVPPSFACEMAPMDERAGDFRAHYAGFIDPGWGWGAGGEGRGRPLVLEIRPFEDIVLRHGQPIAKIRYERMCEIPDIQYDKMESSNYTRSFTVTRLSKHFKQH